METNRKEKVKRTEVKKVRDLVQDFAMETKKLSEKQKLDSMYSFYTGQKPAPTLTREKVLNRILYEQKFGDKKKETRLVLEIQKIMKGKKNTIPRKLKQLVKRSQKLRDFIMVQYLNIKGEEEPARLYPIYSGNMVIIRNRPHEVDPRSFWRFKMGKQSASKLIIKEIDRRPVSNLNYDEIKKRGDATDSDEFLIKAALKAFV